MGDSDLFKDEEEELVLDLDYNKFPGVQGMLMFSFMSCLFLF